MSNVFKAYDIRGIVDKDIDESWVKRLGLACALYFSQHEVFRTAVAYDCRLSSLAFHTALIDGLTQGGIDVISLGMLPTPCLYYGVKCLNLQAGIMITASHNPSEYNGFKIVFGESTLFGDELQRVRSLFEANDFPSSQKLGLLSEHNIIPSYKEDIISRLGKVNSYKVVVDGGNGAGGMICASLLREMGAEVIELYCEPNGLFPNHHPDPIVAENMQDLCKTVVKENADFGIGLDGDGDRIGIVNKKGKLYFGDELLAIFARDILKRIPEALILADVKCSQRLFDDEDLHGKVIMSKTGHSIIKAKMRELGASVGGELSGHMFHADNWYGFDDATYSAARLLAVLTRFQEEENLFLEDLPQWQPSFSTAEITIPCPENLKQSAVQEIIHHYQKLSDKYSINQLDGIRLSSKDKSTGLWAILRPSNTSPYLTFRTEANTQVLCDTLSKEMQYITNSYIDTYNK